jgi:anti-sigma-K factor RskA
MMPPVGGPGAGDAADDPDLDAAEYVLGVLPPDQARAVEALALADPSVAASLHAWEDRLAPLADAVPPVHPPSVLWRRLALAAGLERERGRRRVYSPAERFWRSAGLWQFLTFGSATAAAALAFMLLRPVPPEAPGFLAALSPAGAPGATFLVRIGADGAAVVIAAAPPPQAPGRALELWSLAAGATAPVSLGLLPAEGSTRLQAPVRIGTQLLVSQEPAGGSPTGQPTGPVVFQGAVTPGG